MNRRFVQIKEGTYRDSSWPITLTVRDGHVTVTAPGDAGHQEPDTEVVFRVGVDGKLRKVKSTESVD